MSPEVYERVISAVEQLNYTPSKAAQSLASGQTLILGLVVPDISNSFFAELTRGVEKAAFKNGYNVLLSTTGFDHTRELYALKMIHSKAIDGLIYAAGAPPALSDLLKFSEKIPMVLVDEDLPDLKLPSISSDNFVGGQLVAGHLIDQGHRSALVLHGGEKLFSSARRVEGFRSKWELSPNSRIQLAEGGFTHAGGRSSISPFIEQLRSGEITAVFAANDLMAVGAMEVLFESGIEVPSQVSVVGFDDIHLASFMRPSLTTVRQDGMAMGEVAAERLIKSLKQEDNSISSKDNSQHLFPVKLVVRDSTSAVSLRTNFSEFEGR